MIKEKVGFFAVFPAAEQSVGGGEGITEYFPAGNQRDGNNACALKGGRLKCTVPAGLRISRRFAAPETGKGRLAAPFPIHLILRRTTMLKIHRAVSVKGGKEPCGVDAHEPVRLRPAQRRGIKGIILLPRPQFLHPPADRYILHRGYPETLKGLFAACLVIDQTEDQFPLSPGVAAVRKANR